MRIAYDRDNRRSGVKSLDEAGDQICRARTQRGVHQPYPAAGLGGYTVSAANIPLRSSLIRWSFRPNRLAAS